MLLSKAYQPDTCDQTLMARLFSSLHQSSLRLLTSAILIAAFAAQVHGFTVIFSEDFDSVPLGPAVDEDSMIQNAFSHQPPFGWNNDRSLVPGIGNPLVGVEEWEGWSFANKNFWTEVALPAGGPQFGIRDEFTLGQGTIAVADPDQWNDIGDPANEVGFYNTFLTTPQIDLSTAPDDQLKACFRYGLGLVVVATTAKILIKTVITKPQCSRPIFRAADRLSYYVGSPLPSATRKEILPLIQRESLIRSSNRIAQTSVS